MTNKLQTTRWAFDLSTWSPTLNQLTQAVAVIQPEEKNRLMKFYFINDFLSSLVGRLLMRKYVSECCDLPYEDIKLARDTRGKPYWLQDEMQQLQGKPILNFNVSHQGNLVILAGAVSSAAALGAHCNDFGIGCDIMKLEYSGGRDLQDFFRIMNRKFAESEWKFIKSSHFNQQQQLKAFMRHWCLKESYVKESGVGITINLQKIVFTVDKSKDLAENQTLCGTTLMHNDLPMDQFYFEEHMPHPNYCAAIAFRNFKPQTIDNFKILEINEILPTSVRQDVTEIIDYCRKVLKKPRK